MLYIRLLGQFEVRADAQRIVLPTRASQSLLAYLVLNAGTPQRREKLAGLFWGETSDELARRYLRNELWRIRKTIVQQPSPTGEYLLSDEFTIAFNSHSAYWLDVNALDKSNDDIESLISGLSLYRGELLPGFYDDWLILERERIQGVFENKAGLLLDQLIRAQRWNKVSEWAERWIALGQTPEPAYRALMIAAAAQGDSSKLTLVYERCLEAMRSGLGLDPSAETRALYEQLAQQARVTVRAGSFQLPAVQTSGTVTFLFTDIEGSTKLLESLGDDYATLLADQRDLLRLAAENWNGHEVDTQGDAFFFAFFRAADAIAFSAEAQRALTAHPFPRGASVRVRMGIHTGEPMLARTGYVGMDVHRAARVAAAGHGGQVLVSQSTRELVQNDLAPDLELRDLGEHKLKDLRYPIRIYQLNIAGLPSEFPPLKSGEGNTEAPAPGAPPFKGLEFFDEADAALFFGRETLTEKLVQQLNDSKFLAVIIGASGSGKSSAVRAGLVPALKHQSPDRHVFILTPTEHPLEALAVALTRDHESVTATATLIDDLARDPRSLYLYLRRHSPDSQPSIAKGNAQSAIRDTRFAISQTLLVVDQFEELFTLCADEFERQAFIDNLIYALAQPSAISPQSSVLTLVLTLRADFYSHLAGYPELRDAVSRHQEYIGPMNSEELRRAIEEPARAGGWDFEPGLVDLMLRDVGDEPGSLPLLSHALLETWKRRSGHTMTVKGYQDAGGVRGAIAQTADAVYQSLSPEQQTIARNIFLRLTRLGEGTEDTRRRATMDELIPRAEDAERVRAVVNQLADARLVTTSEHGVEVAHEALMREWGLLREWLSSDREGLRVHRHLTDATQEWDLVEHDAGALYRGAHLAQARDWAESNPEALNDRERAFLAASIDAEQREIEEKELQQARELEAAQTLAETQSRAAKQLRRRAVFLASALLVALVLAGLALFLNNQSRASAVAAETNARLARARELAAGALNQISADPERAIWLAIYAIKTTYDADGTVLPEAANALHSAVQGSQVEYEIKGLVPPINSVAFSPDSTQLVTGNYNDVAKVYDVRTGAELATLHGHTPTYGAFHRKQGVTDARFTSDGKQILTAGLDGTMRVWDAKTGKQTTLFQGSGAINALEIDHQGIRIAAAGTSGALKIWDIVSGSEIDNFQVDGTLAQVAFSPDGSYLAGAVENRRGFIEIPPGKDKGVYVWDLEKDEIIINDPDSQAVTVDFSPDGGLIASGNVSGTITLWSLDTRTAYSTFSGHAGGILAVEFSPDGKKLVSAGSDRTIMIWDVETGNLLQTLNGHEGWVWSLDISPNGLKLASASSDGTAIIWEFATGKQLLTIRNAFDPDGHLAGDNLRFASDGNRILVSDADGVGDGGVNTLSVQADTPGEPLFVLPGPAGSVNFFGVSADGKRIAVRDLGPDGNTLIRIFDATGDGSVVREIYSQTLPIAFTTHAMTAFDSDFSHVAVGNEGKHIDIFELVTATHLSTLATEEYWYASSAAFSPDGKRLAVGTSNRFVQIWDVVTGQKFLDLDSNTNQYLWPAAYSPDGKRIATMSGSGEAQIWDLETGELLQTLRGDAGGLYTANFSADGKQLITAGQDSSAKVWDLETGQLLYTLLGHRNSIYGAVMLPNGKEIATASIDGTIRLWRTERGLEGASMPGQIAHSAKVNPGMQFYTFTENDSLTLELYDAPGQSMSSIQMLSTYTLPVGSGSFVTWFTGPRGEHLLVNLDVGLVQIREAETGKALFSFAAHEGGIYGIDTSPDSDRLLTFGEDGYAKVWDIRDSLKTGTSPKELFTLSGHGRAVNYGLFSPDGTRIVTGTSGDGVVKVWDATDGTELSSLSAHSSSIFALAYNPDGTRLATAGRDGIIKTWDTTTWQELSTLSGHTGPISYVAFSRSGKQLASSSFDGTTKLWDPTTGQELLSLDIKTQSRDALWFSPDDTRLYVSTSDGTREYILPIQDLMQLARSRVTRTLTEEECIKYLNLERCPNE